MKSTPKAHRERMRDIRFLFRSAKEYATDIIGFTVAFSLANILLNIVSVLMIPLVLMCAERALPLTTMALVLAISAIVFVGFAALVRYTDGALAQSRDRFRTCGSTRLVRKALTVSYPLAVDADHTKRLDGAAAAMGKHIGAPAAHIWKTVADLSVNTVCAVVMAAVLIHCDWRLVVVAVTAAVLSAVVHRQVSKRGSRYQACEAEQDALLAYVSRLSGAAKPSKDILVFGLAPWLKAIRHNSMQVLQALAKRRAAIYLIYTVAETVLTLVANGVAYAVLVYAVLTHQMPLWLFILYFAAVGHLTQYVQGTAHHLAASVGEWKSIREYRTYLEYQEPFVYGEGHLPACHQPHVVEMKNVSFSYPSSNKPILSGINLTLKAGEKLAVVGCDGVGKTTLVRLLCGLYDPCDGAVFLDGADVRTLDRRAYYALFSTVFQEGTVMNMTVGEFVSCSADGIDEARLQHCMEQAGIAQTVNALPCGIETILGTDGVHLSGGQMQRLLLARALYKDGELLILDEPTAALDPLAEHMLYQEYARMTQGKSAIFISHRLASTRFCDRIVFLKDGRIAEEGTHDELMTLAGDYARLFDIQSRYYREGRDPDDDDIG